MRAQRVSAMLAGVGIVWCVAGATVAEDSLAPEAAAVESLTAFIADGGS